MGPKNIRFRHGFKKNLNKNLIFAIFSFYCVKISGVRQPLETIENFWPLRGFYVC